MIGLGLAIPTVAVNQRLGAEAPAALPLDGTSSAVLAFSIPFKLRTAYSGSAIRVRRSSDNTEQDIGFSGTVLDTSSLLSFCGAGDGFITKIYDQSGDANAADYVQTTASDQPQIVSSGSIITKDGYAAAQSPTNTEFVTHSNQWTTRPSVPVTVVEVWSEPAVGADVCAMGTASTARYSLFCQNGSSSTAISANAGAGVTYSKNGTVVITDGASTRDDAHTQFCDGSLNVVRHNGLTLTNINWQNIRTAFTSTATGAMPEYWSSQVFYTDTGETSTIEGRIADLYGITLS